MTKADEAWLSDSRQPTSFARGLLASDLRVSLGGPDGHFHLVVQHLEIAPGQVLALTGESGTGKTLLLELLGLMRAPSLMGGTYVWIGDHGQEDLLSLWSQGPRTRALVQTRGSLFGFVPQTGGLLPYLSVFENVALPQRLTGRSDLELILTLLERLDLARLQKALPGQLSVGQRQRVAIARSLAHRPAVLIADEPTAALDPENSDKVLRLLLEAAELADAAVLLSSHEIERLTAFGLPKANILARRSPGETISTLDTRTAV